MLAANLILLGLAIGFFVLAVRGLGGAWPMMLASLGVLALWVVAAVWAVINLLQAFSGDDPADAVRGLLTYALVAAPVTGLGLAFLAFVKCGPVVVPRFFHVLGLVALLVAAVVVLLDGDASTLGRVLAIAVPPVWGLAWLISYLLLRGSVDAAAYASSPAGFKLPFPAGERTWVIQGNNSAFNHNQAHLTQGFAWDFRRPCGTPVLAALAGTVARTSAVRAAPRCSPPSPGRWSA
jgi:hypothetical protein